jgi:thymidylate synthase (FAD)
MNVKLIAVSKPVIEECQTAEDLIAYCARVSNPANQANTETAPRLLDYLIRNQHWSPYEMASMTLEITTTRDIARQMLRHRSFSFQEFSQRYAVTSSKPLIREARLQDQKNRQSSLETDEQELKDWWSGAQATLLKQAEYIYKAALGNGIAKEVARAVLPEGLTESKLYMAGTIRSWIHYVSLRSEAGTQKEHREIAEACKTILLSQFPALQESFNQQRGEM